jgi:hypothetical protein
MAKIDPERERERLAAVYGAMSDLELQKVGRDPSALTDWAFEALREEMARRGLDWAGKNLAVPSQMVGVEAKGDPGNTPFVFRRYRDFPLAMTDRMILETADIDCYLYDENLIRLDWLWSNLLGGLKLVVRRSEAGDAESLLSGKTIEKFDVEGVGEYQQERCPKCGSMDVSCDELKKRIAGAGLLLGVPIAMHQKGWTCNNCSQIWEVAGENKTDTPKQ